MFAHGIMHGAGEAVSPGYLAEVVYAYICSGDLDSSLEFVMVEDASPRMQNIITKVGLIVGRIVYRRIK